MEMTAVWEHLLLHSGETSTKLMAWVPAKGSPRVYTTRIPMEEILVRTYTTSTVVCRKEDT